jgi:hypothetical protein
VVLVEVGEASFGADPVLLLGGRAEVPVGPAGVQQQDVAGPRRVVLVVEGCLQIPRAEVLARGVVDRPAGVPARGGDV